jgi:hypothetical protein
MIFILFPAESLHAYIRIPGPEAVYLKQFRCLNCPGEGILFSALNEDILLYHVTDKVGSLSLYRLDSLLVVD